MRSKAQSIVLDMLINSEAELDYSELDGTWTLWNKQEMECYILADATCEALKRKGLIHEFEPVPRLTRPEIHHYRATTREHHPIGRQN